MPVLTKTGRKSRKGTKQQLQNLSVQEQEQQQQQQQPQASSRKQPLVLQQKKGGAVSVPVTMINTKVPTVQAQPVAALSTTSVVGGKKKDSLSIGQAASAAAATAATAATAAATAPYEKNKGSTASPPKIVLAKKTLSVKAHPVKIPTLQIQPKARPSKTLKRKYSAKRITIHMENPKNVRKTRDAVRRSVANMPLNDITEKLRARGLVRADVCPPENIQRLMLVDIQLFPAPM